MNILVNPDRRRARRAALIDGARAAIAHRLGEATAPVCPHSPASRVAHYWRRGAAIASRMVDQLDAIQP